MKHLQTSFRTFLNYKLNEKTINKTEEFEPENPEEFEPENPETTLPDEPEQEKGGEDESIEDLIKEYQSLMNEWKNKQKKRLNDILQG